MDATTYADPLRTEQTTHFIDALIPKFLEFNLEFTLGYWYADVLSIHLRDNIASEDITVYISEKDFTRWTQAQTPRAANYYLEMIMVEAIAGCPCPDNELEELLTFDLEDGIFII